MINPGQLGPISRVRFCRAMGTTLIISRTGTPSVMVTTSSIPAKLASNIASAANGAGTKITEALAPVAFLASETVLKMGISSKTCPPFPGDTPATTLVP